MSGFLDHLGPEAIRESALLILAVVIAALVLLALAFAVYTFLLRLRNERRAVRWQRLEGAWQEPLLAALDDPEKIPEVQAAVGEKDRLHFVRFVLDYARRVRGRERAVLRELVQPYLGPIALRARSKHREIRTRAVQTLGTLGLPRFTDDVVAALDDPSPLVAMVAARALANEEHPQQARAVLRRLHRFEYWSRNFLASMLAAIGPEGAPALRETLTDTEEPAWVRATAADALRMLDDLEAGDAAAAVAETEGDMELLTASLRLLSVVGRPEHASIVRARCASPDPPVRSAALEALGMLGESEDTNRLLGAMADPSPWVAIHAARGLREAGATELLSDLAESDHPRAPLARQILTEEGEA